LESVERATAKVLNLLGLSRIKSKIIVFSLLATLIPSVSMGWLTYRNNRRVLEEKIAQELAYRTTHTSKELDFWFRERSYEVRVFASSYEVSENLAKIYRSDPVPRGVEPPTSRLGAYLKAVERKFPDYAELLVVDLEGKVVASSRGEGSEVDRLSGWLDRIGAGEFLVYEPYLDERLEAGVIPIAQPVRDADNAIIGALVAKLDLATIEGILAGQTRGELANLYVVDKHGVVLASAKPLPGGFLSVRLDPEVTAELFARETLTHSFTDYRGDDAVGMLKRAGPLDWGVIAEKERSQAYARISRLRNTTLAIVAAMLIVVGLVAYLLGLAIVRPLDRLTAAASKIASGDLNVQLPVYTRGELGYMTTVFNRMAARLRKAMGELDATNRELRRKNEELHRLSITDELTGLHNRKHMMETLAMEVARALRYDKQFSILMIDIDDFKQYNDTYGHLAGDQALRELGAFLRESLRTEDYAARYGGEEFLLLLPETAAEGAGHLAERLRRRLEERAIGAMDGHDGITVSIGVAAFPTNGTDPETLIYRADAAMYQAKKAGRNRVMVSRARRKRAAG
jgi:diguanylate cyclase (GGDEF)-like protein